MTTIDLSQMPRPDVVEALEFEAILAEMLADLRSRDPEFDALVESDPAYKVLEVCAYREMLVRQRVNDAARAVMLAYAAGTDLDHLAALYGVTRLLADPGDPEAIPPVLPVWESDARLRERVQMAPERLSVAGPEGAYRFHALSADADVRDVAVSSPTPGSVLVTVLSQQGDGAPDQGMLDAVDAALTDRTVRPLTDSVSVQAATIIPWSIEAELALFDGPDPAVVLAAAEEAAAAYAAEQHMLGRDITLSGVYAALHRPGVQNVLLASPVDDITVEADEAAWCAEVALTTSTGGGGGE